MDKLSLKLPNGENISHHLLNLLRNAFPDSDGAYISLHDIAQTEFARGHIQLQDDRVLYDPVFPRSAGDVDNARGVNQHIGPAGGLLAAHCHDPNAYWAVSACDYPLITASDLLHLANEYEDPVTAFQNSDGFLEPLMAIWSPAALQALQADVSNGQLSPTSTVDRLKGKRVSPLKEWSLFNTNTPREWRQAMDIMEKRAVS